MFDKILRLKTSLDIVPRAKRFYVYCAQVVRLHQREDKFLRATTETQTQRHGRHYAANAEIAPSETRKSVNRRYAAARNSRRAFKIVTAACVVTLAAAVFAIPFPGGKG